MRRAVFSAVLPLLAAVACAADGTPGWYDPSARPLDPAAAAGGPPGQLACRDPRNFADDYGISALGGVLPDGSVLALATGGAAGGVAPVRLGPAGTAPAPLLPEGAAGSCKSLSLARSAPVALAVCDHDLSGMNRDGGLEVILIDLGAGSAAQVTARNTPWSKLVGAAASGDGRRLAYMTGGVVRWADLDSGEARILGSLPIDLTTARMAMSADGGVVLVGSAALQALWWIDVASGTWVPLDAADGWGAGPDGDLDDAGGRVVYTSAADPTGENPAAATQIFLWNAATETTVQLTRLPGGPARVLAPRFDASGRRIAYLAFAPPDGSIAFPPWVGARVAVVDLAEDGSPGPTQLFPLELSATTLAVAPDGLAVTARVWSSNAGNAGLARLSLVDGAVTMLAEPLGTGEVIDLSRDGTVAAVRRFGQHGPPAGLYDAVGDAPPRAIPWTGSLDRKATRVVALRPTNDGRRLLTVYDVESATERAIAGAEALLGDPFIGPGGVVLSGDGRHALYLSSRDGTRSLYLADLETDEVTTVDGPMTQYPVAAALDERGERALYWLPPREDDSATTPAVVRLFHAPSGARYELFGDADLGDAQGPVALSASGTRAAFCVSLGYDASCRLVTVDLDPSGFPTGLPRSYLGIDVDASLSLSDDGTSITFTGETPGQAGLFRFDPASGAVDRIAPPIMLRAIVRNASCAYNAIDGGAVVARPIAP